MELNNVSFYFYLIFSVQILKNKTKAKQVYSVCLQQNSSKQWKKGYPILLSQTEHPTFSIFPLFKMVSRHPTLPKILLRLQSSFVSLKFLNLYLDTKIAFEVSLMTLKLAFLLV